VSTTANGLTQIAEVRGAESYVSAGDVRLHFGLGEAKIIDCLEVRWPNGTIDRRTGLTVNCEHFLVEGN
jgi:enediyne biosynthesis protein E4